MLLALLNNFSGKVGGVKGGSVDVWFSSHSLCHLIYAVVVTAISWLQRK